MKNILISTGGSGGHVVPAKILSEHLHSNFNVFISTDSRGLKYLDDEKNDIIFKIISNYDINQGIVLLNRFKKLLIAPISNSTDVQQFWLVDSIPSTNSISVAFTLGSE